MARIAPAALAAAIALAGAAHAQGADAIRGTVRFDGKRPATEAIRFDTDPACAKCHPEPVPVQDAVIGPDGALANVIVYVKSPIPAPAKDAAPTSAPVLTMKGCLFEPHVLAMRAGRELEIRNADATLHSLNIKGDAKRNPPLNFAMVNDRVPPRRVPLARPELPVRIRCDVHPWMTALVGVFDHPYFAVTGADGAFEIRGLPPGEYTVAAWHEKFGAMEQQVRVAADAREPVGFQFTASR
jgi:hypothetical protein